MFVSVSFLVDICVWSRRPFTDNMSDPLLNAGVAIGHSQSVEEQVEVSDSGCHKGMTKF